MFTGSGDGVLCTKRSVGLASRSPSSHVWSRPLPESPSTGRAAVIIPTYNEAQNIGLVLEAVAAMPEPVVALVVDANSPDVAADVVRSMMIRYPERIELLERTDKLRLGADFWFGFRDALE